MKTLAERLAHALRERGKTSAELARATGKTESAVSQWLSGETKSMRSDSLMAACALLSCNPQWLASGKGESGLSSSKISSPEPSIVAPCTVARIDQRRPPAPNEVVDLLVSLLEKCDAAARDGLAGALPGLARNPSDPRAIAAVKAWISPHEVERSKQVNG